MKQKKWKLRTITKIEVLKNFRLLCHFDCGSARIFDMNFIKKEKGEMIQPLKAQTYFKRVFLEMGVPTWPNGYDVCADYIYEHSVSCETSEVA